MPMRLIEIVIPESDRGKAESSRSSREELYQDIQEASVITPFISGRRGHIRNSRYQAPNMEGSQESPNSDPCRTEPLAALLTVLIALVIFAL
ncbi:MAG: hypothetical protein COA73_02280 [Candidatus Hydrogenedentota bacterium]|nr:MAG: hypothetical protein COA73_02280 [Candidatus Hydrogenedentota bacterium]